MASTSRETRLALAPSSRLKLTLVVRCWLLRLMLETLGVGKKDFTAEHFISLEALAEEGTEAVLDLPGGVRARRSRGKLALEMKNEEVLPERPLRPGEEVLWGEYRIVLRESGEGEGLRLCAEEDSFSVGSWHSGEGLRLPGTRGRRSLKRLFSERGIDPAKRDGIPVIRCGGKIAAVYSLGIDTAFIPVEGKKIYQVEISKIKR